MEPLRIEYLPTGTLKPYERNARTHTAKQIRKIADSIKAFGFTNPILINNERMVLAGHGRLAAAKLLGMPEVPAVLLGDLSPAQMRAYALADNRLAEEAGWDKALIAIELAYIVELDPALDLSLTGFETAEIDLMMTGDTDAADANIPSANLSGPTTAKKGDLWQLGDHRLFCGDARQQESYARLLGEERAQMVITDPPYNVRINGHAGGSGAIQHSEFVMASGEMSADEFQAFLASSIDRLVANSADGSMHFLFMDWRHMEALMAAANGRYRELKNLVIWNKDNGGMGALYRSKHELVFVYKNGTQPHINNIELGRHGRYRTNVWDYPGLTSLNPGRMDELRMHPTVKPVRLVADAIKDCSKRGGIILDPFAGSGTTLIAAQRTGRLARCMELDPRYVDVAIRRWEADTGEDAIHVDTGETFTQRLAQRAKESGNE